MSNLISVEKRVGKFLGGVGKHLKEKRTIVG